MEIYPLWKNFYYFIIIYPSRDPTIDRSRQVIEEEIDKGNKAKVDETVEHGISNNTQAREDSSERRNGGSVGTIPIEFLRVMNSKGFKKRAPVPPSPLSPKKQKKKKEKKKEKLEEEGKMQDGTDGTIIILDWRARDATRRKRARAHTCRGRRRISRDSQTVRIGGQIIIRSHNRACPFLLLAFSHSPPSPLFFFQWHHENFHLAPLIYRNLNLSLFLSVCV